jgi:magnesium transporter
LQENRDEVHHLIDDLHSADIAELYTRLGEDEGKFLFTVMDNEKAADVLIELDIDERKRVLKNLSSDMIARQLIDNMDTDDAADVLGELSNDRRRKSCRKWRISSMRAILLICLPLMRILPGD